MFKLQGVGWGGGHLATDHLRNLEKPQTIKVYVLIFVQHTPIATIEFPVLSKITRESSFSPLGAK